MPYCSHGLPSTGCRDCGGQGLCPHLHLEGCCRICCPSLVCEHGKLRKACGVCCSRCPHGKFKQQCLDCRGPRICPHGLFSDSCSQCSYYPCLVAGCPWEGYAFAGLSSLKRHTRSRHAGDRAAMRHVLQLHRIPVRCCPMQKRVDGELELFSRSLPPLF